jgi:hypothetical protein
MSGWHVDDGSLARWCAGTATLAESMSVEQHLLACAQCRGRVTLSTAGGATSVDLDDAWGRIAEAVEVPAPTWVERGLLRAGLPAQDARLVAAAPSFRGPWVRGVLLVLAFVAAAAGVGQSRGQALFLLVAPLLPSVAVAFSYDSDIEPALEQELATPYSAVRLVLLRTAAVLTLVLPLVTTLGALLPVPSPSLWLLPSVGFVAGVLALSTWIAPLRAAALLCGTWWLALLLATVSGSPTIMAGPPLQATYVALLAASAVVFHTRRAHLRAGSRS